jgi:hypothetical protein
MPKWPAWIMFGTMAACAYPAMTASPSEPAQRTSNRVKFFAQNAPAPDAARSIKRFDRSEAR